MDHIIGRENFFFQNGAFHSGYETIFTVSGSSIQIQYSRVSTTQHTDYTYYTAGLDLTDCHAAQYAARNRIEAVWRQSGLSIQIPV